MKTALVDANRPHDALARRLRVLVLARMAAGSATAQSEVARELAPYVAHKLAPAAWRNALKETLAALAAQGLLEERPRNRFALTVAGRSAALEELGARSLAKSWAEMRDVRLVALALGMQKQPEAALRALARPDGLRAAVLQQAYGIRPKGPPTPARLRTQLALVALERAFGNSIKAGLGSRTGLSGRLARLLAGQLSVRPRDFGTDQRLVAALAAEKVGSFQTDADSLRVALLRSFVGDLRESAPGEPARTAAEPGPSLPPRPAAASRPDLPGFARAVQSAAVLSAEGWPGSRKAFISRVWRTIESRHPEWGISSVEFKAMLAEAHRTGHIALANADLKDKRDIAEIQASAIAYKNTVWHFVRLEE